jgi:hypothetical protein
MQVLLEDKSFRTNELIGMKLPYSQQAQSHGQRLLFRSTALCGRNPYESATGWNCWTPISLFQQKKSFVVNKQNASYRSQQPSENVPIQTQSRGDARLHLI